MVRPNPSTLAQVSLQASRACRVPNRKLPARNQPPVLLRQPDSFGRHGKGFSRGTQGAPVSSTM